ncbi:MAG: pyridoxamine 5'-phosphate oxidase family protein [Candidatus Freyarchaeum deiterrae]
MKDIISSSHGRISELKRNEMVELVLRNKSGRLGLSVNDEPYVVPVSYAYHEGKIYIHSGRGKKTEYLAKNPRVCFQVDEVYDNGSWKSVIIYGKAKFVEDFQRGLRILFEKFSEPFMRDEDAAIARQRMENFLSTVSGIRAPPSEGGGGMQFYVYEIEVEEMTGRQEIR